MMIERKQALLMDMPDDKRAGYYAQIVKALASNAPLFDRDKELLIFSSPEEREAAFPIMEQYHIPYEFVELLMLPEASETRPGFTDYGFISRSGNVYMYAASVYVFTLHAELPDAEQAQALQQLEEHLLASCPSGGSAPYYVTDAPSDELVHRIAQAYRCEARKVQEKDM